MLHDDADGVVVGVAVLPQPRRFYRWFARAGLSASFVLPISG